MEHNNEMGTVESQKLKGEKFDPEKTLAILKVLNSSSKDLDHDVFCNTLLEFVKILNEMSSALGIAFKDITSKVATIRRNYIVFPEWEGGIFQFIEKEIANKLETFNADNNKKLAKDPKLKGYESTARTVLRMTWFLDFLSVMFGGIGRNPHKAPSDAAKEAYEKCLGPHHPFLLRQAAKVAMVAVPNRKSFEKGLLPGRTSEKICQDMTAIDDELIKVRKTLWDFYTSHKLTELP